MQKKNWAFNFWFFWWTGCNSNTFCPLDDFVANYSTGPGTSAQEKIGVTRPIAKPVKQDLELSPHHICFAMISSCFLRYIVVAVLVSVTETRIVSQEY